MEKKGSGEEQLYHWVPVMTMSKLKLVMLPELGDAVRVNVAITEPPDARSRLARFQVTPRSVGAFEGDQSVVVKLRVTAALPVFLT